MRTYKPGRVDLGAVSCAESTFILPNAKIKDPTSITHFMVKSIGKPCAGKPHARFDEEGLAK